MCLTRENAIKSCETPHIRLQINKCNRKIFHELDKTLYKLTFSNNVNYSRITQITIYVMESPKTEQYPQREHID